MLVRPKALLFDFGGVLADTPDGRSDWLPTLVERVTEVVSGALSAEEIAADVTAGRRAYAHWRDAFARTPEPEELTHEGFWADFVAADWPADARAAVAAHATELVRIWIDRGPAWQVRAGVRESLELAREAGVPAAVVSNTLCGAAMRSFLDREGLAPLFAAQLYSDEIGVRKPNPRFAHLALQALGGVPADAAWFIDDQLSRGILCARRAGVATAVHVYDGPLASADPGPPVASDRPPARAGEEAAALARYAHPRYAPDATVPTMEAFRELLAAALA